MTNTGILLAIIFSCLLIAGCVTDEGSFWELKKEQDFSQLNISFHADEIPFERTEARRNRTGDGWIESGNWQAEESAGKSNIWIYVVTLYHKAFMKKDVRDMENLAKRLSGDSYLDFGRQDKIDTNTGELEYIYYRASGQPCVLIRKYWSDPELSADMGQLDATFAWVAGSNFIYAYYCKPSGPDLGKQELDLLLRGISATAVYWPDDMFIAGDRAF